MKDDDVIATLYSGTEFGRKVQELEHRVSHGDYPAGNAVTLYAYGERLVMPGGNTYKMRTADQSTLTVEDDGQIEEGTVFGCRKAPSQVGRIKAFHSGERLAYAAGEAGQCYEPQVGLTRFTRHLIHVKPDVVIVFDDVELDRPRKAAVHLQFCMVEPTFNVRRHRPHRLALLDKTTARYTGGAAGLVVCVPEALRQTMSITPVAVARGYVDKDSAYHLLNVTAPKARAHHFLTLLLPVQGRPTRQLPDVVETSRRNAVVYTVTKDDTQTTILMPRSKRAVRVGDIRFAGDLLVACQRDDRYVSICALGATEIELSGVRKIHLGARSNVFAERVDNHRRVKKETCK